MLVIQHILTVFQHCAECGRYSGKYTLFFPHESMSWFIWPRVWQKHREMHWRKRDSPDLCPTQKVSCFGFFFPQNILFDFLTIIYLNHFVETIRRLRHQWSGQTDPSLYPGISTTYVTLDKLLNISELQDSQL